MEENTQHPESGEDDEQSLEEVVRAAERLTPLFSMFMRHTSVQNEHAALIQRRKQIGSYILVGAIVAAVSVLGYLGAIDRGATASILGGAVGMIFCRATSG